MMGDIRNSIIYNGQNLYEMAYLRVFSYDVFSAGLRERKVIIPLRSGSYDYGAKYHDERVLRLECLIERQITDEQFDNLKYAFSRKGRVILWDKPDRYYVGQPFNAAEVLEFGRLTAATFTLEVTCEPYAYALEPTAVQTAAPVIHVNYQGTREAPALITIRNTGDAPLYGITITARNVR